jgi:ElaB/YqjD/DUF883 family membrane-anchored ribosome-binding protein
LHLSGNVCQFENADNNKPKANEIIAQIQTGSCKNEAKLREFFKQGATTTTTEATTTEATTTTAIPSISATQFEKLKKMIGELTKKMSNDKKEIMDKLENVEEKLARKMAEELSEVKTKFESKLETLTDQFKAGCTNATIQTDSQLEARVKFIEKNMGIDPQYHNNNNQFP